MMDESYQGRNHDEELIVIFVLFVFAAAAATSEVSAQDRGGRHYSVRSDDHGRHRGNWRKKNAHGYRNYGQYRRTQVGHRRYRTERRYYYSRGVRLSRLVRVYF